MYRHLTSIKDQIIENTFVIANFERIRDRLDDQKAALAQDILPRDLEGAAVLLRVITAERGAVPAHC
jgi:hypothetical protein